VEHGSRRMIHSIPGSFSFPNNRFVSLIPTGGAHLDMRKNVTLYSPDSFNAASINSSVSFNLMQLAL
jgi:hypothetical protein